MRPALDRTNGLLQGVASASDAEASVLTTRKREVARLLANGRSNREIAEKLVIVEVHVKHILSKHGVKSRSQVAAWAAESTH